MNKILASIEKITVVTLAVVRMIRNAKPQLLQRIKEIEDERHKVNQ
jgi:hypothetical protein